MRRNPLHLLAYALLALLLIVALFAPLLAPFDPLASNVPMALQPPSSQHWFGTDQLGRDVFSRTVHATRTDLFIAFTAVAIAGTLGITIGVLAGYIGGWLDAIAGRITDVMVAFPLFVVAMALVAAMGNTLGNVILATAIINLPFYIRLARSETRVRRHAGYVEAARLSGSGTARILAVFLLPNIAAPLVVLASVNLGWAVLNAAGLSFLGLGIRPPVPEWGIMVAEGARFIASGEWWIALFPGLALMLSVLSFNLLGDALRDRLDPRGRG